MLRIDFNTIDYNRFDHDGGEDVFIKRSTILRNSYSYYPEFENKENKKYVITYDPSTKLDNSVIAVCEEIEDPEKRLMLKIVNCVNLIEMLPNGEKAIIQKPEQIEILKQIMLDYNKRALDYDNLSIVCIDAGAGGGRFDIAQFLLNEWKDKSGKLHLGLIDKEDPYMKLREDDYPANVEKLQLFNFKRDKTLAYERAQAAINQGLIMFPKSLNVRNEMEFEEVGADGMTQIRYEKVSFEEMSALIQIDLMKEEIIGMQKQKRPNGTIVFDLSPDAKSRNMHDDHVDCVTMAANYLMLQRAERALALEDKPKDGFKEMFGKMGGSKSNINSSNPFANRGANPFLNKQRPN